MTDPSGLAVEPIIGLEVHVQLATRTKMWCGCAVGFGAEPNTRVCPVCLGLPGALPVMNRQAVEHAILTSLALNCRIADCARWDRKSYHYPDLPKNYQISQYEQPLAKGGFFEFPFERAIRRVRIVRAHLEEDAGRNVHDLPDGTGIDLNRAGTPLLEIVTAPELRSAMEARELAVQLQRLVRYLGVSEAVMQKGQMRFEPNINVRIRRDGEEFRTPIVEVKNLNSFRSLHGAIAFEIDRQVEAWQSDGITAAPGNKSNRGWDDEHEVTVVQREKEEADDYRYFPDPDLVPYEPDPAWVAGLRENLAELPIPRTLRFISEYKIPAQDAPALVDDRATADLLDAAADAGGDKATLARQFLGCWARMANERQTTVGRLGIGADHAAELSRLVTDGKVNASSAARLAREIVARASQGEGASATGPAPTRLAGELGLLQTSDESEIARWIDEAFAANDQAVRDARSVRRRAKAARGFLTGQVMKVSGGKADPQVVGMLIERKLAAMADD